MSTWSISKRVVSLMISISTIQFYKQIHLDFLLNKFPGIHGRELTFFPSSTFFYLRILSRHTAQTSCSHQTRRVGTVGAKYFATHTMQPLLKLFLLVTEILDYRILQNATLVLISSKKIMERTYPSSPSSSPARRFLSLDIRHLMCYP